MHHEHYGHILRRGSQAPAHTQPLGITLQGVFSTPQTCTAGCGSRELSKTAHT